MNSSNIEFNRIIETRWLSFLEARAIDFYNELADDKEANGVIPESLLKTLVERQDKYMAANLRLGAISSLVMLCLFAAQFYSEIEISFFGLSAKSIAQLKELVLFILSMLTIATSSVSYLCAYRGILIRQILRFTLSEKLKPYLSLAYSDEDAVVLFFSASLSRYSWHKGIGALRVGVPLIFFAYLIVFIVLGFYVQASVVIDVWNSPTLPHHISMVVVAVAVGSIVYSVLVFSVCYVPFPYKDYSNLQRLKDLEKSDVARYKEVIANIARENDRREGSFIYTYSLVSFAILYSIFSLALGGVESVNSLEFAAPLLLHSSLATFATGYALIIVKRRGQHRLFDMPAKSKEEQLRRFRRHVRNQRWYRVLIPLGYAFAMTIFVHRNSISFTSIFRSLQAFVL